MMEQAGTGPVVNSDSANWFFLPELQQEFPDAKYVIIHRDRASVDRELAEIGMDDNSMMFSGYDRLDVPAGAMIVRFEEWTPNTSLSIVDFISQSQVTVKQSWHELMHRMWIQVTRTYIDKLRDHGKRGGLAHITARLKGVTSCQ